jgi:peptidylprolyl isomerase
VLETSVIRFVLCAALALAAFAMTARAQTPDPQNTLVIELKTGKVLVKLRPDLAPKHVERAKVLAKQGFYDGLKFHRVIDGFMAQTGDPTGTGMSGSKLPNLPAEFTKEVYKRGSIGAARTPDPNSANSQFFICFGNGCRGLTGEYTLWGEVIEGMEHVDKIARGEPPPRPDVMVKVYLLADAKK